MWHFSCIRELSSGFSRREDSRRRSELQNHAILRSSSFRPHEQPSGTLAPLWITCGKLLLPTKSVNLTCRCPLLCGAWLDSCDYGNLPLESWSYKRRAAAETSLSVASLDSKVLTRKNPSAITSKASVACRVIREASALMCHSARNAARRCRKY